MIIGTHTSDNLENSLQIAHVQLPKDESETTDKEFDALKSGTLFFCFFKIES